MPFCLEGAGTDDVTEGPQQQSSSGGSWTPWSNCPSGFSAVGLRRLVLRGSLVDGEVSSVDQVECTGTGCRAKNPKYGTKPTPEDPIGVWSLTKEKTYDTMRMWDCSSSGCRIGCIGSGKMTLAKATCSTAHQNLQVVASSSGSGTRTPAACPSTHNSAGCVCYSSTEGSCPAENYQVGKLTGSCSKNFGSASGTVTRLCTQAVGRLRVSIGNEITELDDLTAGYVYKSVAITSANTGNANMKFRELGEDTVLWTDCGAPYSKGWNLKQSNSAPGNFQLVERAREGASNAKACVNPKSGKLVECAPESQVEEHIKQREDNHLVSCGTGQVLSSYLFKQDTSCNHVDDFRYFHSCTAIIPVTTTSSCVGQLSDLSALQHHHLQCPRDSGLKRFILEAQVPEVAADETLQGEVRYNFALGGHLLPGGPDRREARLHAARGQLASDVCAQKHAAGQQ
eukprot:g20276.t1